MRLIAYIEETRDRESNTFYRAEIVDHEDYQTLEELADYDRDALITEVTNKYHGIEIENA